MAESTTLPRPRFVRPHPLTVPPPLRLLQAERPITRARTARGGEAWLSAWYGGMSQLPGGARAAANAAAPIRTRTRRRLHRHLHRNLRYRSADGCLGPPPRAILSKCACGFRHSRRQRSGGI
jgi:hypothetical protein